MNVSVAEQFKRVPIHEGTNTISNRRKVANLDMINLQDLSFHTQSYNEMVRRESIFTKQMKKSGGKGIVFEKAKQQVENARKDRLLFFNKLKEADSYIETELDPALLVSYNDLRTQHAEITILQFKIEQLSKFRDDISVEEYATTSSTEWIFLDKKLKEITAELERMQRQADKLIKEYNFSYKQYNSILLLRNSVRGIRFLEHDLPKIRNANELYTLLESDPLLQITGESGAMYSSDVLLQLIKNCRVSADNPVNKFPIIDLPLSLQEVIRKVIGQDKKQ